MLSVATTDLPRSNATKSTAMRSAMEVASGVLRAAVHDAGTGAGGGVDGGGTFANPEEHMLPSETWWWAG